MTKKQSKKIKKEIISLTLMLNELTDIREICDTIAEYNELTVQINSLMVSIQQLIYS